MFDQVFQVVVFEKNGGESLFSLKKYAIVATLLVMLAIVAMPASAAGLFDNMAPTSIDIVYAQSFHDSDLSTAALKLGFPVYTDTIFGKDYSVNVDAIGFMNSQKVGVGGSITIENVISALDLGIGYLPDGYEWSFYVGVKALTF